MRKFILALSTCFALFGPSAHAQDLTTEAASGALYTCRLRGHLSGGSVAFFFGGQMLEGPGTLRCTHNVNGTTFSRPVTLKLAGAGVGFELSHIRNAVVFTAGIGVNTPDFFYQSFAVGASAGASLIRTGLEADLALRLSNQAGFGFELGMKGQDILGLGAHLYGMVFSIEPR